MLLVLTVLIVLAAAAALILQDHVVFTPDGFYFDFQKPTQEAQTPDTDIGQDDSAEDVPLVIEDGSSNSPTTPDPTPEDSVPGSPSEREPFSALLATPEQIISGETLPTSYDALAVTVKGTDGVMWVADSMNAENGTADVAADFRSALSGSDTYKIAVASALLDPLRPRYIDRTSALKVESGSIWLDWDYCSWFSPYETGTAEYLKALLQSCADAGFNEVVLTDFQFPTRGKTELINYGTQSVGKAEALASLAQQLKRNDLTVSCLLTDTAASGGKDEAAGQDAALLAKTFGKVWVRCSSPGDTASLRAQLGDNAVALWLTTESTAQNLPDHIFEP